MHELDPLAWPNAPAWAIAIGTLGRCLIFGSLLMFSCSALAWAISFKNALLGRLGAVCLTLGALGLLGAFGCLLTLFVTDQFEFSYIFSHSDKLTELRYKVAAVWSGQEGSFLLWATGSSIFALLAARRTGQYRRWFSVAYAVFLGSLAGILAYESPFHLNLLAGRPILPPDGRGMTPSLLNYWITIHPPTIFLGFGSLTVIYCWALSALAESQLDAWAKMIRPWAITSLALLGLGLCMGGFWAYETLGWGGFWAWDPVENASFVPWLLCVALIHGLFVQLAKGKWHFGNVLLAGSTLIAFVYGTFLTRSGFLADTSVHSFAQMDRSALRLLIGMLSVGIVSFLSLWIMRLRQAKRMAKVPVEDSPSEGLFHKHAFYGLAVWLSVGLGLATAFGMSVPLFMTLLGRQTKVVDEALYHKVVVWFFIPIVVLMGIGPYLGWRGMSARALAIRLSTIFWLTLGGLGLIMLWIKNPEHGVGIDIADTVDFPFGLKVPLLPWMAFLIGISLFGFLANGWRVIDVARRSRASIGGLIMHVGVIVTLAGLIISRGFQKKQQFYVRQDQPSFALGYAISYKGRTKDYLDRNNHVLFDMEGNGERFQVEPSLYYIPQEDNKPPSPMVWPSIHRHPFYDVYFTLGALLFEATDPIPFKVGQQQIFDGILITYNKMVRKGEAGMAGTKFFADVTLKSAKGEAHARPSLAIAKGNLDYTPARVDDQYFISLVSMDAADKTAYLQFQYASPRYPVELFYKPMTILVWLGAGIMTLGGIVATFYRRSALRGAAKSKPAHATERTPQS